MKMPLTTGVWLIWQQGEDPMLVLLVAYQVTMVMGVMVTIGDGSDGYYGN